MEQLRPTWKLNPPRESVLHSQNADALSTGKCVGHQERLSVDLSGSPNAKGQPDENTVALNLCNCASKFIIQCGQQRISSVLLRARGLGCFWNLRAQRASPRPGSFSCKGQKVNLFLLSAEKLLLAHVISLLSGKHGHQQ